MEEEILIIQEAIEDYNNMATLKEQSKINNKWMEIKKALKYKQKVNNISIIYFALMSYCEDSIYSEKDRINLIENAWIKIKNKIL